MLSNRLKELRHEKNVLQKDIAKKLNISTSAYGFYEQGKRTPDLATLESLADYFNVSIDYLLGRTNDRTTSIENSDKQHLSIEDLDLPQEIMKDVKLFFYDGNFDEKDKDKIVREILEIYWDSKKSNENT